MLLLLYVVNPEDWKVSERIIGLGAGSFPGAVVGRVAFTAEQVKEFNMLEESCILVKDTLFPEDLDLLNVK